MGCYTIEGGGEIDLLEENWDYLIILDACRYDFFRRNYPRYFSGNLEKAISPASETREWLKIIFEKRYEDLIYVSANPYINSLGAGEFKAGNRFCEVIDVWDYGWNDQLGTVHPREVNKAVASLINEQPDRRCIVHYFQPHAPYITWKTSHLRESNRLKDRKTSLFQGGTYILNEFLEQAQRRLSSKTKEVLKQSINTKFGLLHPLPKQWVWRNRRVWSHFANWPYEIAFWAGNEVLRRAYEENLRVVLKYASQLSAELSGSIIITADHGELLGEGKKYGHYPGRRIPELVEVPWFKVKGVNPAFKSLSKHVGKSEKVKIFERVRSLRRGDEI
jgi:hypothetical protein